MHKTEPLSRELSLIAIGLIKDKGFKLNKFQIDDMFELVWIL